MKQELYEKLFARMDELGAIRENLDLQHITNREQRLCDPVLSDCNYAIYGEFCPEKADEYIKQISLSWFYNEPYLYDQSDELGEKLLSILE